MIHNLSQQNSILNQFIAEIRDTKIHSDRLRFRKNLERIGEILAFEISKALPFSKKTIETPLAKCECQLPSEQPVLGLIFRAAAPLHQGLLNFFDHADNAFVAAYRKHTTGDNFEIDLGYLACAKLENKILILADPMLATGQSIVATLEKMKKAGTPKEIHIACAIASKQGVDFVQKYNSNIHIWAGAIDPELNPKAYIVPGLGDAGDLAFGEKIQH